VAVSGSGASILCAPRLEIYEGNEKALYADIDCATLRDCLGAVNCFYLFSNMGALRAFLHNKTST